MEGGGRTWARTKDPLIKSQLLYQLSYASTLSVSDFPPAALALCARPVPPGALPIATESREGRGFFRKMSRDFEICQRPPRPQRSTAMIVPMHSMLVIIDEPPWLMNGSGIPTTGASPITIDRLIAT